MDQRDAEAGGTAKAWAWSPGTSGMLRGCQASLRKVHLGRTRKKGLSETQTEAPSLSQEGDREGTVRTSQSQAAVRGVWAERQ